MRYPGILLLFSLVFSGLAYPPISAFPVAQTETDAAQTAFNRALRQRNIGTAEALNQAIADLETARNLWREAGNVAQEVTALNWLGLVYTDLGRYSEAIAVYRQILERLPAARDDENRPFTEASTLLSTAKILARRGDYQGAMEQLARSLELWQKVGYSAGEAAVRNELGLLYVRLGDFDRALEEFDRLFAEIEGLGTGDKAALLNNRGQVRAERGESETALEDYRQALNLWQELGKIREQAATLNNIGFAQTDSEKFREALDTYNEALPLWRESGDRGGEASTLSNIGFVYTRLNEPEKALEFCDRALPLRRELGDRDREAMTRYCLAIAYRQQGNLTEARSHIETALNIIEDLRTNVNRQELRTTFFASKQEYYEFYIDLLMELHRQSPESGFDGLALQASERAKARSLLDILAEGNGEITAGIDPKLLAEKQQLQQQLAAAEARRVKLLSGSHTDEQKEAITDEIEDLLDRLETLRDTIRATSPRYASLTQPQPLDLEAIQREILDENTALLEYAIGRDRSYLWVVTSAEIRSYELPGKEEIEATVRQFRDSILVSSLRIRQSVFQKAGTDLRDMIIPAELPDKQRLVIVADGALQYVPFVALPTEGTQIWDEKKVPLIVRHEVITLPSASTLGVLRQQIKGRTPPPKTLAIFADPVFGCDDDRVQPSPTCEGKDLPPELERSARESGVLFDRLIYTQTEAEQILSLIPESEVAPKFGFSARREVATTPELSNYKMLHFATHGLLNSANPELSGLVLSLVDERGQLLNGFLRLYDIFNLNLPAELVVLSACETGLGQRVRGEGLIGLTRGFMYAGAPRVVVSLWSVDDRATAELMVKFYQKMLDGGQSPAAALRSAQIELWQSSEWNSPFFWAGFTLQGEWEE